MYGLIDEPPPYGPLEKWEHYLTQLKSLPDTDPAEKAWLIKRAEKTISSLKNQQEKAQNGEGEA
jgi:hypothetical protein